LFALVALSVVLVAIWTTWSLTAPYRVLEHAVHRIGGDLKSSPLPEDGSREYKAAARAVNTMQSKLLDYVAEREQLAAALAHDLRTPLTRIRLRLALVEDEALAKSLAKDLSDIEAISRSVIDFATSELANEEKEKVDLWSLLLSIADNYPDATLDERNSDMLDAIAYCQPVSVQRSITNLIDNAIAYGGKAKLSLRQENNELGLGEKDNGPGIPADQIEGMVNPFNHGAKARI